MKEGCLVDEIEELGEAQSVKLADDSEHVESSAPMCNKCRLVEGGAGCKLQAAAAAFGQVGRVAPVKKVKLYRR